MKLTSLLILVTSLLSTTSVGFRPAAWSHGQESYAVVAKQFGDAVEKGDAKAMSSLSMKLAKLKNPAAIPLMIGAIESDNTLATIHGIGFFGLGAMTGVSYDEKHDGKFWRGWWNENKSKYPAVKDMPIPAFRVPAVEKADVAIPNAGDVSHIPSIALYAGGDRNKLFFLSGKTSPAPASGFKLMVILPGGPGTVDFHPFVKRIQANALSSDYLVAQPVPPSWSSSQIVWPNAKLSVDGMRFTTEEFIEAVITDVKGKFKINPKYIFTMGWSSSGPPVYSHSFAKKKSSTGAFVSMSVFNAGGMPPIEDVSGFPFYILHSPEDWIKISQAESARDTLRGAGAKVEFATYSGGHGWQGDVFGNIRGAIAWLEANVKG